MRWFFLSDGSAVNRDHIVRLYTTVDNHLLVQLTAHEGPLFVSRHPTKDCAEEALKDACVGREHVCHRV